MYLNTELRQVAKTVSGVTLSSAGVINLPYISHTTVPLPLPLPLINVGSNTKNDENVSNQHWKREGEVGKVGILDQVGIQS